MTAKKSVFDEFTGKYQLSKTLRFELKPVGKTADALKENKVFEKDQTIDDSYNQAKFYFDKLHQDFINDALAPEKISIDFADFAAFLADKEAIIRRTRQQINEARSANRATDSLQQTINKAEQEIKERKQSMYKEILARLDEEAEDWKQHYLATGVLNEKILKKENAKGVGFLTSAGVLNILKDRYPEEKDAEFQAKDMPSLYVDERENPGAKRYIFDSFDGFSTYLEKFQETRKNIYSHERKATALATRIVDNFELFLANKKAFESKYSRNHSDIGFETTDVFAVENYKYYLRQSGIETLQQEGNDASYNKVIGRINARIKEFRDRKASQAKQLGEKFQKSDYPLFKTLEKQILGEIEKHGQLIEATHSKSEEEVFVDRFKEFIDMNEERFSIAKDFMQRFFADDEFASQYEGIFLKNTSINTISRRWLADSYLFESLLPQAKKDKKEGDVVKVKKFVTLADVKNAVEQQEGVPFKDVFYQKGIIAADQPKWQQFLSIWQHEFESLFTDSERGDGTINKGYNSYLEEARTLQTFSKQRKKEDVAKVKNYADASLRIYQLMKYLALEENEVADQSGISTDFYAELDAYAKEFDFIHYYNAFRNFVTKRSYAEDKIKLNFEKGSLLDGWAESPEGNAQFHGYILRRGEKYFLGITDSSTILDFDKHTDMQPQGDGTYEKMIYRQLKSTSIYGSAYEGKYGTKYAEDKEKLSDNELVERVKGLLRDKYLHIYPELKEILDTKYDTANELAKALSDKSLYTLEFEPVASRYVESIEHSIKGKTKYLYLFEITNKDFSKNAKGRPNIHSLYFKNLFSEANLQNPTLKLSGGAEVFYRPKTEELPRRKDTQGKEVIEHKRYAEDKMLFHLPLVINMSAGRAKQFNTDVNQLLADNPDVNIIGLDRGEKHLVYYSVVNQQGDILDQGSFNEINGQNYYQKLVEREKERRESRQSWNSVAKIKDLKQGYVSQVVRKIVDLAIEHNAIVVMEDLNMRFKQVRGGIERSVYQQLEKQLIDKLSYLIFKDRKPNDPGGVLNGYQLAAPFESFEKMGKQTGIVFYTQAEYTSVTDPLTGFRKNIYISNSAPQHKIKEAIEKFDAIGWDYEEQSYFFNYNPIDFVDAKFKKATHARQWTVHAKAPRIRREKDENGYWQQTPINLNEKFHELFNAWEFEQPQAEDLREEILRKMNDGELDGKRTVDGKERDFYHAFIYFFNLILDLRNSFSEQWESYEDEDGTTRYKKVGEDVDFIASPVKPFFSTYAASKKHGELSPQNFADFNAKIIRSDAEKIKASFNGDANGAYNVARKGAIILKSIDKKPEKPDLFISKYDWDTFVQGEK